MVWLTLVTALGTAWGAEMAASHGEAKTATTNNDFYKAFKVIRRGPQSPVGPIQTFSDESCYNYFSLLNSKPVLPAGGVGYRKAMRKIYAGGRIVIHNTGSAADTLKSVVKGHRGKYGDMGYHFYLRNNGGQCEVFEGRPLHKMGDHAGYTPTRADGCRARGNFSQVHDFDFKAIGIVMEGNMNSNGPSKECQKTLSGLVQSLGHNLGIQRIGGHAHYRHGGTDCPGHHLKNWVKASFGRPSQWQYEGTGARGETNISEMIRKANPAPPGKSTFAFADSFGADAKTVANRPAHRTIPFTEAMRRGKIPPGTVPVNDLISADKVKNCANCGRKGGA